MSSFVLCELFTLQHPGGQEAHLRVAGKDASRCFDEVGHSEEAEALMKKYRIGVVARGGADAYVTSPVRMTTMP